MKTQAIYTESSPRTLCSLWNAFLASRPVVSLAAWFSRLSDQEVTPRQAVCLVHAQVAFAALVLLGGSSPLVAVLLFAWFGLSVWQCAE